MTTKTTESVKLRCEYTACPWCANEIHLAKNGDFECPHCKGRGYFTREKRIALAQRIARAQARLRVAELYLQVCQQDALAAGYTADGSLGLCRTGNTPCGQIGRAHV